MKEQRQKSTLVEFKEDSIRLRNELSTERDESKKGVLRLKLNSARFWERLLESIIFVLLVAILSGCHTVNGVGRDLSAWSSPYIEHQEK